jgi:hypothetical protein
MIQIAALRVQAGSRSPSAARITRCATASEWCASRYA